MNLDVKIVWQAIFRLLNHYPESGHNKQTLAKLSEDYWEDFKAEGITTVEQLKPSLSLARRRCKFFPKSSDIISAYKELKAKRRISMPVMIEEKTSMHDLLPEEVERNKEMIAISRDAILRKITWEEAEKRQEALLRG